MMIKTRRLEEFFPYIQHKIVCVPRSAKESNVFPGCCRYGTKVVERFEADMIEGFKDAFDAHELNVWKENPVFEGVGEQIFDGNCYDLAYILTGKDFFNGDGHLDGYDSGLLADYIDSLPPFVPNEGDLVLEDDWELDLSSWTGKTLTVHLKSFYHDFSLFDPVLPEKVSVCHRIVHTKGVKHEANA